MNVLLSLFLILVLSFWKGAEVKAQTMCLMPLAIADNFDGGEIGRQIVLKAGAGDGQQGWYGAVDFDGGGGGADEYRDSIVNCNAPPIQTGDVLRQESGNMVGPTKQGVENLISQDPDAYWDTSNLCVVTSQLRTNPRIVVIPLIDPSHFASTGELRVSRFAQIFLEAILGGKDVVARLTTPNRICTVTEPSGEGSCNDGLDNDGDGLTDREDPDCAPA